MGSRPEIVAGFFNHILCGFLDLIGPDCCVELRHSLTEFIARLVLTSTGELKCKENNADEGNHYETRKLHFPIHRLFSPRAARSRRSSDSIPEETKKGQPQTRGCPITRN